VRRLIRKKYKPEHIIDKIAFIINMEWAVEHIEKILHNLNSNEYDLVYINSGELQCRKYLRRHICGIISIEEVIKHKLCYRLAVTTHADHISIEYGIELIAEKMMLIASMLDFDYCKYMVVKNYDFIICANRHQEKQFQKIISNDKLFILGSPRFDDSKNYNEAAKLIITNHVAEGINWDKNTLLWLPTHTEISPFIYFTPMIAKLQNEFNIILKPHIALYREIKNLDAHIRSIIPEIIIIKDINYIELLPAVDFVICDYGGLVFSAIKADKNVLLFNTPNPELLTGNFAPASPANIIRDRIINFYPDEEEKFFAALKDDSIWEKQKEIRRQIRAEFFTENPNPARDIADLCRHIVKGEA
jgi:hypothetical protein